MYGSRPRKSPASIYSLIFSNSTTFRAIFEKLIFTFKIVKFYIYTSPIFLQIYNFFLTKFYILQPFFLNSTSTSTLNFYNSTIFFWPFSTFYNDFLGQIYNLHLPHPPPYEVFICQKKMKFAMLYHTCI